MRFTSMLLGAALAAACTLGCGGSDGDEGPAADSLGLDTSTASVPMDTTSVSDSLNAPVRLDSSATGADTTAPIAPSASKGAHDTVVTPISPSTSEAPASGSPSDAGSRRGAANVGSGARRNTNTTVDAGGRRSSDTGSATRRR